MKGHDDCGGVDRRRATVIPAKSTAAIKYTLRPPWFVVVKLAAAPSDVLELLRR